jgi:hypothetical protein
MVKRSDRSTAGSGGAHLRVVPSPGDSDTAQPPSPDSGAPDPAGRARASREPIGVDLGAWPVLDVSSLDPADLVTLITASDPLTAGVQENLGVVAACEQVMRFISALQVRHIAGSVRHARPFSAVKGALTGAEESAAELAPMLGLSRGRATERVSTAEDLVNDSPKLLALVQAGVLDLYRACTIDGAMREILDPGSWQWDTVQDVMAAAAASGHTSGQLRTPPAARSRSSTPRPRSVGTRRLRTTGR